MSEHTQYCECYDPGCPHCHGQCNNEASTVLNRSDMEDLFGTCLCDLCASSAIDSGSYIDLEEIFFYMDCLESRGGAA